MSGPDIAVSIPCDGWVETLPGVEALCLRVTAAALGHSAVDLVGMPLDRLEISLVLADDALVQSLNRDYRGQDKPTNVLSFAALDDEDAPEPEDCPVLLGDVVLAFETTFGEAELQGKPLADHLSHLLVHGVLHLLGYDHEEDSDAEAMESLERTILEGLGIPDPFAR